jgi:peptidoglycan/LPS O-acetylase OafA/YrhL
MKERLYYMDILRLIAVSLVMFGHFVMAGTFATTIPGIINAEHDNFMPLFKSSGWKLWVFDQKLVEIFHTQAGVVGVLIFFLITGYLITIMQSRYSRQSFIINRLFRIFPALFFCALLVGCFVYFTQNIKFGFLSYLASVTLSYEFLMVVPIIGVLWTLIVEMLFYIIAFMIGRFNNYNILFLQTSLLIIIHQSALFNNSYLDLVATYSKYILFILIGVVVKLSESEENYFHKIIMMISSIFFAYLEAVVNLNF